MIESTLLLPANLAIGLPGPTEMIVLLVIGLLIFGRRLPEVGRSIGRSIVEFKRGVKGINEEIETESSHSGDSAPQLASETPPGIEPAATSSTTSSNADAKAK